jgi:hypothetical protein
VIDRLGDRFGGAGNHNLFECPSYVGYLHLSTVPLPLAVWLLALPFTLGLLALEELRKWLVRRY